jgi:predicted glycogen debranching enzyme
MKLPTLTLSKESLMRFGEVIEQEWLITNGLGSYGSSTVPAINTRKYHGLLVAALNPPGDHTVCLSKLDEDLIVGEDTFRLGANEFHDVIYPEGYKLITEFTLSPYPTYSYDAGNVAVKKTVFLPQNKNAAAILYHITNRNSTDIKIKLYPLLNCRYYHTVINHKRAPIDFTQKSSAREVQTTFLNPKAAMICRISEGKFVERLNWVEQLHYRDETMRGEADLDDCFQPGYFELQVSAGAEKDFAVTCAVSPENQQTQQILDFIGDSTLEIDTAFILELKKKEDLLAAFYLSHPLAPMSDWLNWILLAADSFLVQNAAGKKSVLAGYHWFESWGRDTFISLPGLTLVTGRFSDAKDILANFMSYLKDGMIPNLVDDKTGVPIYNTVDGTLWYVNAVLKYVKYTGDFGFVKTQLWTKLQDIIEHHMRGTMFGVRLDEDGLLMHGPRLTWMDAVVDGDMITPRAGKAVEIQALWYNTLRTMEMLAGKFSDDALADKYDAMAERTKSSFTENFWNPKQGCLYDVLAPDGADALLRPNQIFAVSLDYSMLNAADSRRVVEVVNRSLVTPFGLRTLSMDDPKFVGKCMGDRRSRDNSYHNGTIWPWLLGPYVSAYLKVNDYTAEARKQALENMILPLFTVGIHQGGLGTINEIYDCEPPNAPRGCISQAWSIAEPLRAYIEDVLKVKPAAKF